MVQYSGWLISLILLGIIVIILFLSIVTHFYEYIPVYRSSRVFIVILSVIIFVGEIILWNRVYDTIAGRLDLRWPNLTTIFLIICWGILIGFFAFSLKKYGKNWWFRQKFARNKRYGPYLVFTDTPETSIIICFYDRTSFIENHNPESLHPQIYTSNDAQTNDSKANIEYIPFRSFEIPIKGLYRFKITNLKPATQYFYRIPCSSTIFSFKTSPSISMTESSNARETRFLIAGDLHGGSGDNSLMYNLIAKTIRTENIDFILNTGDLLSDSSILSQYKTFFSQAKDIITKVPILHTTGNHDGYRKKGARIWRTHFPQSFPNPLVGAYCLLTFGSIAIICIDFYNSGNLYEDISQEQRKWIEQTLDELTENSGIERVFFSIHHPIACTGDCGINKMMLEYFTTLFDAYPKITGVFSGHTHFFQLFEYTAHRRAEPIIFLITGGAGTELERSSLKKCYPRPYLCLKSEITDPKDFVAKNYRKELQNDSFITDFHRFTKITHHFCIITIRGKNIELKAIDRDGTVFFESPQ